MVLDGEGTNGNWVDDETCGSNGQILSRNRRVRGDFDAIDESVRAKEGEKLVSGGGRGGERNVGRRGQAYTASPAPPTRAIRVVSDRNS